MNHDGEYRYTPAGVPGPCPEHPGCYLTRCRRFSATAPSTSRCAAPANPAGTAHPPAGWPSIGGSADERHHDEHQPPNQTGT